MNNSEELWARSDGWQEAWKACHPDQRPAFQKLMEVAEEARQAGISSLVTTVVPLIDSDSAGGGTMVFAKEGTTLTMHEAWTILASIDKFLCHQDVEHPTYRVVTLTYDDQGETKDIIPIDMFLQQFEGGLT